MHNALPNSKRKRITTTSSSQFQPLSKTEENLEEIATQFMEVLEYSDRKKKILKKYKIKLINVIVFIGMLSSSGDKGIEAKEGINILVQRKFRIASSAISKILEKTGLFKAFSRSEKTKSFLRLVDDFQSILTKKYNEVPKKEARDEKSKKKKRPEKKQKTEHLDKEYSHLLRNYTINVRPKNKTPDDYQQESEKAKEISNIGGNEIQKRAPEQSLGFLEEPKSSWRLDKLFISEPQTSNQQGSQRNPYLSSYPPEQPSSIPMGYSLLPQTYSPDSRSFFSSQQFYPQATFPPQMWGGSLQNKLYYQRELQGHVQPSYQECLPQQVTQSFICPHSFSQQLMQQPDIYTQSAQDSSQLQKKVPSQMATQTDLSQRHSDIHYIARKGLLGAKREPSKTFQKSYPPHPNSLLQKSTGGERKNSAKCSTRSNSDSLETASAFYVKSPSNQ